MTRHASSTLGTTLIIIGALVGLLILATVYYKDNNKVTDSFQDSSVQAAVQPAGSYVPQAAVPDNTNINNVGCFPKDNLTAADLLPKNAANSQFSQIMPAGQGDVGSQNWLTAGYQIGMSSSVLRNANMQLRSEPACPQIVVSPFLQTTIDPDLLRKPLEVDESNQCGL